ncbi:MAG: helix-turn-helix transcriptional regulator, partial [Trebonia sp.]
TGLGSCLDRLSSPVGRWHYLEGAATLALATGRFADAVRLAREGFKLSSDMGHPAAIGGLSVILSQSCLHIGLDQSGLAEMYDLIPAHLRPDAISLGRTQDIEFLAERFGPFRGQHVANGAGSGTYMGPVELQLGLAAAALGHLDAAVADLAAAVTTCDANGARGYAVQARVEFATALARRQAPGDLDEAAAVLDAAASEAGQLGMVPFTSRIGLLRTRLPAAPAARSPLSPRELEVARLVARGLTNKQIGQALYVSERTAENHVQHILVKLGFSNRSQIAAWSSEGRATDA